MQRELIRSLLLPAIHSQDSTIFPLNRQRERGGGWGERERECNQNNTSEEFRRKQSMVCLDLECLILKTNFSKGENYEQLEFGFI